MTRLDIISEQCIRNDEDVMAVNNENKKVAWKMYHKKLCEYKTCIE